MSNTTTNNPHKSIRVDIRVRNILNKFSGELVDEKNIFDYDKAARLLCKHYKGGVEINIATLQEGLRKFRLKLPKNPAPRLVTNQERTQRIIPWHETPAAHRRVAHIVLERYHHFKVEELLMDYTKLLAEVWAEIFGLDNLKVIEQELLPDSIVIDEKKNVLIDLEKQVKLLIAVHEHTNEIPSLLGLGKAREKIEALVDELEKLSTGRVYLYDSEENQCYVLEARETDDGRRLDNYHLIFNIIINGFNLRLEETNNLPETTGVAKQA